MSVTWEQAEKIAVTRYFDYEALRDRTRVNTFPAVIDVTDEFLCFCDPDCVTIEQDSIRFHVDNGWCRYRVVDRREAQGRTLYERLAAWGDPA